MIDPICPRCRKPCPPNEWAAFRRHEECWLDANALPYDRFRCEQEQKRAAVEELVQDLERP